jgi:hypothetical protein
VRLAHRVIGFGLFALTVPIAVHCLLAYGVQLTSGSLVSMSFTSTTTGSNYLSFTLLVGRRGAWVPAAKGPLSISGNGTALDRLSGVERAARRSG